MLPHQSNSLSYALGSFRYTHAPYDHRDTLDQSQPLPQFNLAHSTYYPHTLTMGNSASTSDWPIATLQSVAAGSACIIASPQRVSVTAPEAVTLDAPVEKQSAEIGGEHVHRWSERSRAWLRDQANRSSARKEDTWIASASTSAGSNAIHCRPAAHGIEDDLEHPSKITLSQSPGVSDKGKSNQTNEISRIDGPQESAVHPQANASKSSHIPESDRSGSYSPVRAAPEHDPWVGPPRRIMPKLKKDGTYETRFTENVSGLVVKNARKRRPRGELGELEHEGRYVILVA